MVPETQSGCDKCGHTETEVGTISTTGGGLGKMFDVQTNSFEVVSYTGGTRRLPRGRPEIFDFHDDERRSLSNHLTPRLKPTASYILGLYN